MSGAKPGPSSEITISIGVVVPPCIHLDGGAGEIDRVLEDVADAVEDRRIARADRLRPTATAMRTLMSTPKSRCGATASSISVDSFMRSNGAPVGGELGDLGQNVAAALRLLAQGLEVGGKLGVVLQRLSPARARSGRWSTSGVPSSCAAAAARPSSWVRCCSRVSTSSVAASASASLRASSVTWNE